MNANMARLLNRQQYSLVALSAPTLLREPKPQALRPPMATAPLAQSLSLRELVGLNRLQYGRA